MNIKSILLSVLALAVMLVAVFTLKSEKTSNTYFVKEMKEESMRESAEAKGSADYFHMLRANQNTGIIDERDVFMSVEQANNLLSVSNKTTALNQLKWNERGPNNVGGRTRGLVSDKADPNKLIMGMVSGGFWSSNDDGNNWTRMAGSDSNMRTSVTTITQAANGDLYYGTGESFTGSGTYPGGSMGLPGGGVFKSTDGGASVTLLQATKPSFTNNGGTWSYVNRLAAHPTDPNKIIAAVNNGLWQTTDGGSSWTPLVASSAPFLDVEISTSGNVILASTVNNMYLSTDGGANFTPGVNSTSIGLPGASGINRVEIALAPSDENIMYAVMSVSGGTKGCYKSIDKGASWTAIGIGGSQTWNPLGDQGYYDIAFAVHPTNPDMVFLGGQLDLYRYTPQALWVPIAYANNSAQNGVYVHADMHGVMFNSANPNKMYVVTDGGIFRTQDCTAPNPFFVEKNKDYVTAQCYGVASNTIGHIIFGSQDNGTYLLNGSIANSAKTAIDQIGGDGMRGAASSLFPKYLFGESQNGVMRRATNGGVTGYAAYNSIYDKNIDAPATPTSTPDGKPNEGSPWIAPITLAENASGTATKSVLFIGFNNNVWFTQDAVGTGIVIWFPLITETGAQYSSIAVNKDGTVAYVGNRSGQVKRITGIDLFNTKYVYDDTVSNLNSDGFAMGSSFVKTAMPSPWSNRYITDIKCNDAGNEVLVTVPNYGNSDYVYRSTNATSATPSFLSIQGNLPSMPVYSVGILSQANSYIVGTELGVYGTDNGGASWVDLNNYGGSMNEWHPRLPTTQIAIQPALYQEGGQYVGDVIYTGTWGRGTFSSTSYATLTQYPASVSNAAKSNDKLQVYPNPVNDQANVKYTASKNSAATVQVISLTGKVLRNENVQLAAGSNAFNVDMSNLTKGVYMISIRSTNGIATTKVVKR